MNNNDLKLWISESICTEFVVSGHDCHQANASEHTDYKRFRENAHEIFEHPLLVSTVRKVGKVHFIIYSEQSDFDMSVFNLILIRHMKRYHHLQRYVFGVN